MLEGLRQYVALAGGLTEVSRRRALDTAKTLAAQAPTPGAAPVPRQVQQLADDLVATARSNRRLLEQLVRGEVVRAADALGLVRRDELVALERRLESLEDEVAGLHTTRAAPAGAKRTPARQASAARQASVKRAAPAKRAPAKRATATRTQPTRVPAKRTADQRAGAAPETAAPPPRTGEGGDE
ncbi:MAG TPA: hypothetical protein VK894_03010 [Jiangellales bacterium]|nr:hypothetical protein [Jiangellales bacterium]